MGDNEKLLAEYVAVFEKYDDLDCDSMYKDEFQDFDDLLKILKTHTNTQYDYLTWRPTKVNTPRSALDELYSKLPGRFPTLFEDLLLNYRWLEVDLWEYQLYPNFNYEDSLKSFITMIEYDSCMSEFLLKKGYIQFADFQHDAICFDTNSSNNPDEMKIIQLDHEDILCWDKLNIKKELAPNFEQLVRYTIDDVVNIDEKRRENNEVIYRSVNSFLQSVVDDKKVINEEFGQINSDFVKWAKDFLEETSDDKYKS